MRQFLQRALEGFGYSVTVAVDGADALQCFERDGAYDLLVTDFAMPTMRGDELAGELRRRQPWLKVIYLTGFAESLYQSHPDFSIHETTLEKPVALAELHDAVSMAIFGHRGGPSR